MSETPRVSVILPVYNQADHIESLIGEYLNALNEFPDPFELLLVVNGPRRDDSLAICQRLDEENPSVRALVTDDGGWGLAVRYGLREARGESLCYTNSARTSAEDLVLHLLYARMFPDVVVKANRKIRESIFRRLGSLSYNIICRMLFDFVFWDINGTPKVFSRSHTKLLEMEETGDLIDLEFNVICSEANYRMLEVPIFATMRKGGTSTTNLRTAFKLYAGAFKMWRRRKGKA